MLWVLRKVPILGIFLSTLSLRRATRNSQNINRGHQISIHALLAESDIVKNRPRPSTRIFLSTLSLRRATIVHLALFNRTIYISIHALLAESDGCAPSANGGVASISIHALLAESDSALAAEENPTQYFYPRSPCGERRRPGLFFQ